MSPLFGADISRGGPAGADPRHGIESGAKAALVVVRAPRTAPQSVRSPRLIFARLVRAKVLG